MGIKNKIKKGPKMIILVWSLVIGTLSAVDSSGINKTQQAAQQTAQQAAKQAAQQAEQQAAQTENDATTGQNTALALHNLANTGYAIQSYPRQRRLFFTLGALAAGLAAKAAIGAKAAAVVGAKLAAKFAAKASIKTLTKKAAYWAKKNGYKWVKRGNRYVKKKIRGGRRCRGRRCRRRRRRCKYIRRSGYYLSGYARGYRGRLFRSRWTAMRLCNRVSSCSGLTWYRNKGYDLSSGRRFNRSRSNGVAYRKICYRY